MKDRTAALKRAKTLTLGLLKRQSQQRLAQIGIIDRERATILAGHARFKARFDIRLSLPGLGAATSLALLIDMPQLAAMDAKQAGSRAGLAPLTRQSATWQGKSFIHGGRATLRQAVYMPALVAIMRKLVIIANALLRDHRKSTSEMA